MTRQRFPWGAMWVATVAMAGCGGSGSANDAALENATHGIDTTAPAPASAVLPEPVSVPAADALKPVPPGDFHPHGLAAFTAWRYDYANASLKLLISAFGPKALLDHLEDFKNAASDAGQAAAAGRFMEIIRQAYHAEASVDTQPFIESLRELAPFNRRNAAGQLEYELAGETFMAPKDPEPFLALFSQLFRLDTLAGWSFDIVESYVHQGEERMHPGTRDPFQMFQPVQLSQVKPEDYANFSLQKLVDLLQAPAQAQIRWNKGDTTLTTVQVHRRVSIADVQQLKRLTIGVEGAAPQLLSFSLGDSVTLAAFDQKTGQDVLLTLAPRQALVWKPTGHAIRIRNADGRWMTHEDGRVLPTRAHEDQDRARLINFAVTRVAPGR